MGLCGDERANVASSVQSPAPHGDEWQRLGTSRGAPSGKRFRLDAALKFLFARLSGIEQFVTVVGFVWGVVWVKMLIHGGNRRRWRWVCSTAFSKPGTRQVTAPSGQVTPRP